MEPPEFPASGLPTVRAAQGSAADLLLPHPKGTPPFHYQWSRAGASLDERFSTSQEAGGVRLTVRAATTGDSGLYTLQASNAAGSDTARVRLEVCPDELPSGADPPTFLRRLQDLTVKVGTRTRFLVEIISNTECKVTWYRNERRLLEAERVSLIRDGNFYCAEVSAVSVDDAGRWSCLAENCGGRASCSAHLNVLVPKAYKRPEFVEELRALLTEQGTVSLECKVVGVPTPVLRWFKDSREIKAGDVFALTANAEDPTSLGTYTCEAVNCMGRTYSSSKVHVVGRGSREGSAKPSHGVSLEPPPIFTKELQDQFVKICDRLTLSCHIVVPPWPRSVVWYNKEGKVEPSERYHVIEDGVGGYLIEVQSAEWPDEGEWKCVATSAGGRVGISTSYVAMEVPKNYRKPRFMENLQAVLTEEGLVSFECKVVGFPTPVLSWFKDGQELKPGDVYQLTGTNSLGSYCCIARNCMGQASSSAELTVEDIQNQLNEEEKLQLFAKNQAPKFLQGLKSVEAKIDEPFSFTIKVAIPPEPSVLWYRDDQPVDESPRCHLNKEDKGVFTLDINSLEFLDQAEWKCVAMNDFGHSVTSCFLKLIIPKSYKKPRFLENLQAILSDEGAVNLECKVIGVPQPILKWYKDGEELKPGDIHRIISGQDGTCCLGTYTCEAQNCMGIASSSASLLGFDDSMKAKKKKAEEQALQRNLSLSTIHEERTSQMYDTPVGDITMDDKGEISFSFDGKEVSVSLYETPDLTEEEALQIVEMYADQLSENVTEHNVVELPPLRFVKETSTSGNLLMEAIIIDVSPEYFASPEEDLRTEADVDDISIADENAPPQLSLDTDLGEDYIEKTMALLSEEKADISGIPKRAARKKSDSMKSIDDYFSLSREQSLSEKKDDDTQMFSESDMPSFASARSSGKAKSKSSAKPSDVDGKLSPDIKNVLANDEAQKYPSETEQTPTPKPKRERRRSRSSRRSSSGSEKSFGKYKEEPKKLEVQTSSSMSDEEFKTKITNISSILSKIINDVQIIERDIILKSELMSSAAAASRSLEVISSLITPLSEIHSIADATKESLSGSKEVTIALFNSLPQPLKTLQQSLTIIEKCIDDSDNKTLVKKTCVAFIKSSGADVQKMMSEFSSITCRKYLTVEEKILSEVDLLTKEITTVIKYSMETIKTRNLSGESIETKPEEPSFEAKHLRDTQKAVFELKSPLNSLLSIAESADTGRIVDIPKIKNSEVILHDMSASIQDLQTALEQIESLSVKEEQIHLHKYNTTIIETVMESILKLRSSLEQLSKETKNEEDNAVLNKSLSSIKTNLNEISAHISKIEHNIGTFDILQSDNKLEVLQKMAQILIALENNLSHLELLPEIKIHMGVFHKNLTKVLENVIESNDSRKYFTLIEICDAVNRVNAAISNIDSDNILSLASLGNTLQIIHDHFVKNVFEAELNCSILANIADVIVGIQEDLTHAEEVSLRVDSERAQDISAHELEQTKANVIIEHIEQTIAAISNIKSLESVKEMNLLFIPAIENISSVLEELKYSVASIRPSGVEKEEHVSELSDISFNQTFVTPICELNENIVTLNEMIVENLDSIKEHGDLIAAVAEPLHELYSTLEILQQDVVSQFGDDVKFYDVSTHVANSVQNLQSCIVMIQEQAGVEAADDMSTLEDISGIKTTAETIPSECLVLPEAEVTAVEQSLEPFIGEGAATATAQALQTLNEHITVLQTPDIIDALDTLSEVSDYSSLRSVVLGLGELHSGIEEILHPVIMESSNEINFLVNESKLMAIAEPMQEIQQSLSVLDLSNIPIYEHILEMPAEKIHSVLKSITEFKEQLTKCIHAVFPAMETADKTIEISNKVETLRDICENLKDIIQHAKTRPESITNEVIILEETVNDLLTATDVSKGIRIDQVKEITEKLYQNVINAQEEIVHFTPQTPDKFIEEAKMIQAIDEIESNIAVLEQFEFVDLSRASDITSCISPQLALELESDTLMQMEDIVENAVNIVQHSTQETPVVDLMILEDFFKTCKNEFTILRCLMNKQLSHKKIIRLLQEFNSMQNTINEFKLKRAELRLSSDIDAYLSTFFIHADDCMKNIQSSLIKVVKSQAEMLLIIPLNTVDKMSNILTATPYNNEFLQLHDIVKYLVEIIEVTKPWIINAESQIIEEIKNPSPEAYNIDDTIMTEKLENMKATVVNLLKGDTLDQKSRCALQDMLTCIQKHEIYKDAAGTGKLLIILKLLSECSNILDQQVLEDAAKVENVKSKIEENILKTVLSEMLEPLQTLHNKLLNVQEQILSGAEEDSISIDIVSTESLVQTMTEIHKEMIQQIGTVNVSFENEDISLIMEVDKEIHAIQDSIHTMDNTQVAEIVKDITKPIEDIEKSLHNILSSEDVKLESKEKLPLDVNSNIGSLKYALMRFISIESDIANVSKIFDNIDILKSIEMAVEFNELLTSGNEDVSSAKLDELRYKKCFAFKQLLSNFDWLDTEKYLEGLNLSETVKLKSAFLTIYQLLAELEQVEKMSRANSDHDIQKEKAKEILQQMDQYIELIEIVEEITAVIKIDDLKKTAIELRENIAASETISEVGGAIWEEIKVHQIHLAQQVQKAIATFQIQILENVQELATALGAEVLQRIAKVSTQLHADLVSVTGTQVVIQVLTDFESEITKSIENAFKVKLAEEAKELIAITLKTDVKQEVAEPSKVAGVSEVTEVSKVAQISETAGVREVTEVAKVSEVASDQVDIEDQVFIPALESLPEAEISKLEEVNDMAIVSEEAAVLTEEVEVPKAEVTVTDTISQYVEQVLSEAIETVDGLKTEQTYVVPDVLADESKATFTKTLLPEDVQSSEALAKPEVIETLLQHLKKFTSDKVTEVVDIFSKSVNDEQLTHAIEEAQILLESISQTETFTNSDQAQSAVQLHQTLSSIQDLEIHSSHDLLAILSHQDIQRFSCLSTQLYSDLTAFIASINADDLSQTKIAEITAIDLTEDERGKQISVDPILSQISIENLAITALESLEILEPNDVTKDKAVATENDHHVLMVEEVANECVPKIQQQDSISIEKVEVITDDINEHLDKLSQKLQSYTSDQMVQVIGKLSALTNDDQLIQSVHMAQELRATIILDNTDINSKQSQLATQLHEALTVVKNIVTNFTKDLKKVVSTEEMLSLATASTELQQDLQNIILTIHPEVQQDSDAHINETKMSDTEIINLPTDNVHAETEMTTDTKILDQSQVLKPTELVEDIPVALKIEGVNMLIADTLLDQESDTKLDSNIIENIEHKSESKTKAPMIQHLEQFTSEAEVISKLSATVHISDDLLKSVGVAQELLESFSGDKCESILPCTVTIQQARLVTQLQRIVTILQEVAQNSLGELTAVVGEDAAQRVVSVSELLTQDLAVFSSQVHLTQADKAAASADQVVADQTALDQPPPTIHPAHAIEEAQSVPETDGQKIQENVTDMATTQPLEAAVQKEITDQQKTVKVKDTQVVEQVKVDEQVASEFTSVVKQAELTKDDTDILTTDSGAIQDKFTENFLKISVRKDTHNQQEAAVVTDTQVVEQFKFDEQVPTEVITDIEQAEVTEGIKDKLTEKPLETIFEHKTSDQKNISEAIAVDTIVDAKVAEPDKVDKQVAADVTAIKNLAEVADKMINIPTKDGVALQDKFTEKPLEIIVEERTSDQQAALETVAITNTRVVEQVTHTEGSKEIVKEETTTTDAVQPDDIAVNKEQVKIIEPLLQHLEQFTSEDMADVVSKLSAIMHSDDDLLKSVGVAQELLESVSGDRCDSILPCTISEQQARLVTHLQRAVSILKEVAQLSLGELTAVVGEDAAQCVVSVSELLTQDLAEFSTQVQLTQADEAAPSADQVVADQSVADQPPPTLHPSQAIDEAQGVPKTDGQKIQENVTDMAATQPLEAAVQKEITDQQKTVTVKDTQVVEQVKVDKQVASEANAVVEQAEVTEQMIDISTEGTKETQDKFTENLETSVGEKAPDHLKTAVVTDTQVEEQVKFDEQLPSEVITDIEQAEVIEGIKDKLTKKPLETIVEHKTPDQKNISEAIGVDTVVEAKVTEPDKVDKQVAADVTAIKNLAEVADKMINIPTKDGVALQDKFTEKPLEIFVEEKTSDQQAALETVAITDTCVVEQLPDTEGSEEVVKEETPMTDAVLADDSAVNEEQVKIIEPLLQHLEQFTSEDMVQVVSKLSAIKHSDDLLKSVGAAQELLESVSGDKCESISPCFISEQQVRLVTQLQRAVTTLQEAAQHSLGELTAVVGEDAAQCVISVSELLTQDLAVFSTQVQLTQANEAAPSADQAADDQTAPDQLPSTLHPAQAIDKALDVTETDGQIIKEIVDIASTQALKEAVKKEITDQQETVTVKDTQAVEQCKIDEQMATEVTLVVEQAEVTEDVKDVMIKDIESTQIELTEKPLEITDRQVASEATSVVDKQVVQQLEVVKQVGTEVTPIVDQAKVFETMIDTPSKDSQSIEDKSITEDDIKTDDGVVKVLVDDVGQRTIYEPFNLLQHIEIFVSEQMNEVLEDLSMLPSIQDVKQAVTVAKELHKNIVSIGINESLVDVAVTKENNVTEQATLLLKLQNALSTVQTQVLENVQELNFSDIPSLQFVSETVTSLQNDLKEASVSSSPEVMKIDLIELAEPIEEDSLKQLESLLQEASSTITAPQRTIEDTDVLRDTLDEVQTVIIKLKRDCDGATNDTLNETLEDLECSVRSVQLQINEDSPPDLLKEACATLVLLANNISDLQTPQEIHVSKTVSRTEMIKSAIEKCTNETDETVSLLSIAAETDTKDLSQLTSIVSSLKNIKDILQSLRSNFLGNSETLIDKGVELIQKLDQIEDKVFSLEKDIDTESNLTLDFRENIVTAIHSVYSSISNMRSTISSIQKQYLYENYGKPTEYILSSIKNVSKISKSEKEDSKIQWKKFSKTLRSVLNHFEDIKFYVNFDKTARLPSDATFTKIILEELRCNMAIVVVPEASNYGSNLTNVVKTALKCVDNLLTSIEPRDTLEVKEKIPMFKQIALQMFTVTKSMKAALEKKEISELSAKYEVEDQEKEIQKEEVQQSIKIIEEIEFKPQATIEELTPSTSTDEEIKTGFAKQPLSEDKTIEDKKLKTEIREPSPAIKSEEEIKILYEQFQEDIEEPSTYSKEKIEQDASKDIHLEKEHEAFEKLEEDHNEVTQPQDKTSKIIEEAQMPEELTVAQTEPKTGLQEVKESIVKTEVVTLEDEKEIKKGAYAPVKVKESKLLSKKEERQVLEENKETDIEPKKEEVNMKVTTEHEFQKLQEKVEEVPTETRTLGEATIPEEKASTSKFEAEIEARKTEVIDEEAVIKEKVKTQKKQFNQPSEMTEKVENMENAKVGEFLEEAQTETKELDKQKLQRHEAQLQEETETAEVKADHENGPILIKKEESERIEKDAEKAEIDTESPLLEIRIHEEEEDRFLKEKDAEERPSIDEKERLKTEKESHTLKKETEEKARQEEKSSIKEEYQGLEDEKRAKKEEDERIQKEKIEAEEKAKIYEEDPIQNEEDGAEKRESEEMAQMEEDKLILEEKKQKEEEKRLQEEKKERERLKKEAKAKAKQDKITKVQKDKEDAEETMKREAEEGANKEEEKCIQKEKEEAESTQKEAEEKAKQGKEEHLQTVKLEAQIDDKEVDETVDKDVEVDVERIRKETEEKVLKCEEKELLLLTEKEEADKAKKRTEITATQNEEDQIQEELYKVEKEEDERDHKEKIEAEEIAKKDEEKIIQKDKEEGDKIKIQSETKAKQEEHHKKKEESDNEEVLEKQPQIHNKDQIQKKKEEADKIKEKSEDKRKKEEEERLLKEKIQKEEEKRLQQERDDAEKLKAEKIKRETEEKANREEKVRLQKEEEDRVQIKIEEKAKREQEERLQKEKEEAENIQKEAEQIARQEEEKRILKEKEEADKLQKKEEEKVRKDKEEHICKEKKDADRIMKEAEENAMIEEIEKAKKVEDEKAKREAEERQRKEMEEAERLKKLEEERLRQEQEEAEKNIKEAEEKAKKEEENRISEEKLKKEEEGRFEQEKNEAERLQKEAKAKAKKEWLVKLQKDKEEAEKIKKVAEDEVKKEEERIYREKDEAEKNRKKEEIRIQKELEETERLKNEAEVIAKREEETVLQEKQEAIKIMKEAEEKAKKEAEDRLRKKKDETDRVKKEAEEKAKKEKEIDMVQNQEDERLRKYKEEAKMVKKAEELLQQEKEVADRTNREAQEIARKQENDRIRKEKEELEENVRKEEEYRIEGKEKEAADAKARIEEEEHLLVEMIVKEEKERLEQEIEQAEKLKKEAKAKAKQEKLAKVKKEKEKTEEMKRETEAKSKKEEERIQKQKEDTDRIRKEADEIARKEKERAENLKKEAEKDKEKRTADKFKKVSEEKTKKEKEYGKLEKNIKEEETQKLKEQESVTRLREDTVKSAEESKYSSRKDERRKERLSQDASNGNGSVKKNHRDKLCERLITAEDTSTRKVTSVSKISGYDSQDYEVSRKREDREKPTFIDRNYKDYTMEFARPSGYREKSFDSRNILSERDSHGRSPVIYKAQTLVLDSKLRSSLPPASEMPLYKTPEMERRSEIRTRSKALSEARSMTSEKRSSVPRDSRRKPVFSTYLTDRTAVEGSRVKLTCSVLSPGDPTITWYKNGAPLDNKLKYRTKFVDGLITLEVLNAVPTDSAEYSCTVQNENGSISSSANLKVYPSFEASPIPPTFTRSIRDTYHLAENELVLECRIRGQPLPTITWIKDDRPVTANDRFQAFYLADGVCRLAISSPTPEDSGKYTCKAENSMWSDQITHVVSFTGKCERTLSPNITTLERSHFNRQAMESRRPHFSNVLSDYQVASGGTIGLQVEIRGSPTRVEWLREGRSVTEIHRNARTYVEQGLYTLALADVTEMESGMYTCRAWSTHGTVDMNAAITVVQPTDFDGKPAIIVGRPEKDVLISVGEDLNISFRVQGEPKPKVVFMKGIRDITNSNRVCKMTSDDYVKFTLKRAGVSDAGTYCILARNAYGCDRAFVTTVVRQRVSSENLISDWTYPLDDSVLAISERKYKFVPERIPGEPSVVDGGNNWVSIAWPKPDCEPGSPVLAYKIENWLLGKEGGARWIELGITPLNSFDAFNLKQGEQYHFRVTPRNRYGWGEPVQTSTPISVGFAGDAPEFLTILPGQLKVLLGETANLSCSVKGKPTPEVVWMKNGHDFDEDRRVRTSFNGEDCCLTIEGVSEDDEARYSCEATNEHGRASTYARIAVVTDRLVWEADAKLKRERSADVAGDYPPQFTMRLRDRRVQATYPVRLTCQVVGSPAPSVTWFKDGQQLTMDNRRNTSKDELFHTLEIAPTNLEDGGVYEALARNSSGAVSCRCSLVVDKGIRAYIAPEFCCGLEPLYRLREGDELRISAVVEAYPSVGVTWYREGVRIRPSRRAIMTLDRDGQTELAIASVTPRDAGVYTCTASNEVGRASTSGKLEVIEDLNSEKKKSPPMVVSPDVPYSKEPRFLRKPRSSEAREGDTVIIECEVIGDPKPDVYWLRDFLKPDYYRDASHFKRVGSGQEYRFEIPHAKLDYTGAYSVVARNEHGEAKAIISLQILARDPSATEEHNVRYGRVEVIPRFERNLTDLLSYDGDAVEFECRLTGNPEPTIRWYHYNDLIRESADFETSFEEGTARLRIPQVTAEDEGTWTCEAANTLGKASSSACLVVYPPGEPNTLSQRLRRPPALSAASTPRSTPRTTPSRSVSRQRTPGPDPRQLCSPTRQNSAAPKFYTYPFNKVVEEGETVVFKCAAQGLPTPWATWDKDGVILTPTSRITIKEKDEMLKILEIEQVTIEDVGVYRITLENDFGLVEASARLEVITQKGKFYAGVRAYSPSPRRALAYKKRP